MIEYTYNAAMTFADNATEAILLAKLNAEPVRFVFEGITFDLTAKATVSDLMRDYYYHRPKPPAPESRKPYSES